MRRFLSLSIIVLALIATLWPVFVARAQGPDEILADWTVHHWSELLDLENGPSQGALCSTGDPLIGYAYSPGDYYLSSASVTRASDCSWALGAFEAVSPQIFVGSGGGSIQFTVVGDSGQPDGYNAQWHVYTYDGSSWSGSSGNHGQGTHTISIPEDAQQIAITYWSPFFYIGPTPYITNVQYINIETQPSGQTCPTVNDAEFTGAITDTWLVSGGSTITNSILTLPVSGLAAQNLALDSLTTYNAVISTTSSVSSTDLTVRLGTDSQTVSITGTGQFTATFTTTSLGGPVAYSLENTGSNSVTLDFTCLYPSYSDGSTTGCIAPTNGEFTSAANWIFQRGAEWDTPSQKAFLPYADVALVYSTPVFSLPTITGTERLLISFNSRKITSADTGAVMGRVHSGGSSVNWLFETYPIEYIYEASLDTLAGLSNVDVAFVNPGLTGSESISATADIVVDDVCIFVANRGPNLPTPTDPNAVPPVDLGFNYTSCDDTDGILSFFGVNIQQYRAQYEAGASVWDPIGWVPWLISAMWMTLATWLCIFMAAFTTLMQTLEYILNNLLNYGSWMVRSWTNFRAFLVSLLVWLLATLPNLTAWLSAALVQLLVWFLLSGGNLYTFFGFVINWGLGIVLDVLSWLATELLPRLVQLAINGFTAVVNGLITGWNLFLPILAWVFSTILDVIVTLWNLLTPFLGAVWTYISGGGSLTAELYSLLWLMFTSLWDLFWMVLRWVWVNVFSVIYIPVNFYYAFDTGIKSEAFAFILSCADQNFWCSLLAGIQLLNQVSAHTVVYPVVIVGIIVGSIAIFWRHIWALFSIEIS